MAAIAFDTLQCTDRLISAGMPERQARMQSEIMSEAFIHNVDALVTKDFLEKCLELQDEKTDGKFRIVYLTQSIIMAAVVIPLLQCFFS